ncbi:MAG TPA: MFS transporter [Candidatus Binatia bacterium]|nr:MFS transporter [Candidatus Binatia bacterium]
MVELAETISQPLVERPPYRWWVLANVVLVSVLVPGIAWNYIIMVVPDLLGDLGLPIGQWGVLWAGISLGMLVASIPAGALGDHFGARHSVGWGMVLLSLSLLLRATAAGFLTMFGAMVLFGLALGVVFANLTKAIAVWFPPDELGMASGVGQAGIGLGIGVATLVTPLLLTPLGGWRGLTRLLGYVTLALAAFWLLTVRDRALGGSSTAGRGRVWEAMGQVLAVKELRVVALCSFLFFGGNLGTLGYFPTYLVTVQGMSAQAAGGIATLAPWAFILGAILLPLLSDRLGRRKVVYIAGIFASGLIVFAYTYLLGRPLVLAAITLGLVAGAVVLLFVVPIEMEGVGPRLAGSAIGVVNAAGFAGGVLMPLLGMKLVQVRPVLGLGLWAGCFVLSALCFAAVRETGSRASERRVA